MTHPARIPSACRWAVPPATVSRAAALFAEPHLAEPHLAEPHMAEPHIAEPRFVGGLS